MTVVTPCARRHAAATTPPRGYPGLAYHHPPWGRVHAGHPPPPPHASTPPSSLHHTNPAASPPRGAARVAAPARPRGHRRGGGVRPAGVRWRGGRPAPPRARPPSPGLAAAPPPLRPTTPAASAPRGAARVAARTWRPRGHRRDDGGPPARAGSDCGRAALGGWVGAAGALLALGAPPTAGGQRWWASRPRRESSSGWR